ncbi:TonB-dependent receptor [Hymenobacter terricola]|uniref:TonB-dependent receptor n=1 Tax=Hymenobacter terricola TaxID=2819236 RepID=UPI001B300609|nr:TonB-dependent receptor [Hymenobacter terricola]
MPNFTLVRGGFAPFRFVQLLLLGLLLLSRPVLAQEPAALSGTVTNGTGTAVEFATITLHRAADSVVVKTEFSDAQGHFQLSAKAGGRYLVSAAQVGFARYWSPAFELPAAGLQLPEIRLTTSRSAALKEVTITARKPLFEHLADRTVVNVADSPLSAGATALDVLGRSPGLTLDGSDNLVLRGRQGLLVLVDGKRVPLTGLELADYLKALPAEQLQSIELITNPPAQYDAQGGAGVIAINLRKDQSQGTNGSLNASYGRGEYGKFTSTLAMNHRRKGLNIYGSYSYNDRTNFVRLNFDRQYAATPLLPAASSVLATEQVAHLRTHTGKLGFDWALSKRTLLGVAVSGLASQNDITTTNFTQLFGPAGEPLSRYNSLTPQEMSRPNGGANVNLRHAFADSATASAITVDADMARYNTTRLLDLTTYFVEPAATTTLLHGDQRSALTIQALKADFSQPLPHRARLEAGAKSTRVTSDNNVQFVSTANGISTPVPAASSQFRYHENVNAAYVNLRGTASKTTLQAGLRAEQTNTLAETAGDATRERHYFQLFPSATVQHQLNERHQLGLSVTRRIDRPSYGQINPLRIYLDATSYQSGNPALVAQTSYNFELTHTYRQKFTTALTYAQTDNPIVRAVQPAPDGGRLVVNRDVNLTTEHYAALTLTVPLELAKWWTLYANGVFYYARFQGELAGTALDRGQMAFGLTANSSFTLPHGWSADLNGSYDSREKFGFEVVSNRGQVAAGIQKSLWAKQGTLRLNATDIFYTLPVRSTSAYTDFTETFYRRQDTRVVTVAFTYRFGNSKVAAARKRAIGAEDELRRAGQ